jgi:Rha family phage regulatory protein
MSAALQFQEFVHEHKGRPATTSRIVAKYFDKQHKNVTRTIVQLMQQATGLTFERSSFLDQSGKEATEYLMDRKAFMILAMRFTGIEALQIQIAFVDAFEAMESFIQGLRGKRTAAEMLHESTRQLVEQERALALVSSRVDEHDIKLDEVRAIAIKADSRNSAMTGFYTVKAFCNIKNIRLMKDEAAVLGKVSARLTREKNLTIEKVRDEAFGQVNAYPEQILDEAYRLYCTGVRR